jgi:type I thyroxine 5'-deiodinase
MHHPYDAEINSTEQTYTAWPDRIYLIDATGHVAYKSKPGPFGFKPEELTSALARVSATPVKR